MKRRSRILLYTHEYPPFKGGAGEYCSQIAAALSLKGLAVTVVAPYDLECRTGPNPVAGPRVIRNLGKSPLRNSWFLLWLTLRYRISHIIVGEAAAISSFRATPPPSLRYSIVAHGTEIINSFHPRRSQVSHSNQDRLKRFYRGAYSIIHSSIATLRCVQECGLELSRPVKVYPAVDPSSFPLPRESEVRKVKQRYGLTDEQVILNVARFGIDKGQDVLLRAFALVHDFLPEAKLILVGAGPMRDHLEGLAADLGVENFVIFPGEVLGEEIPAYHASSTLFVMVSRSIQRFESFGIVYLEAALCHRASVGGNHGGVPEAVIDGVTGLIVDPEDVDAVAEAILKMLGESEFRGLLAENAYQRAVSDFNLETMAESLVAGGTPAIPPAGRSSWRVLGHGLWAWRLIVFSAVRLPFVFHRWLTGG